MTRPGGREAGARGSRRDGPKAGSPRDCSDQKGSQEGVTYSRDGSCPQSGTRPGENREQAPTEFDRQFQTMFETMIDGMLVADCQTRRFHAANPAFCRMVGYTPEELRQMGVADLHPKDHVAYHIEQFDMGGRQQLTLLRDAVVKRKDGSTFYADIHTIPVILAGNSCIVGFFRDVSERKQAHDRLVESEEKYRTLVESAGETIAMVDREGAFLFMNKMAAARLGGAPDDYAGKTMWDLFPQPIADRQVGSVRKVIDAGEGVNVTAPTVVQGQQRWYNTTIEPIRDATGRIAAALVIGRDIDELRRTQQELEQYREKMSRAERLASLGALSATIAHELTQPLTVSRLSLQEAMAQLETTQCPPAILDTLRECLEGISDATHRVDRLRCFARLSSKQTPHEIRLEDIVKSTLRLLAGKASARRISLHMQALGTLPPIRGDEKDLEQMCFALVENAIHAADRKKPRKLVISGRAADGRVTLRFEDNCGGIIPAHMGKVFAPFFTTKPDGEGTGLGLCIVERVVTQMQGEIRVENRPGEGVAFCVTLPEQDLDVAAPPHSK
jgi:PAS domain S-box-containing protein